MELTNEQWNRIGPIITATSPVKDPRGRKERDPRDVMNGILWILRTGAPWKDLPPRYPPYQTCHRRFAGKKRGLAVGKTKRGKGTKIMAIADAAGFPVAAYVESASPHEVKLVEETIDSSFTEYAPARLIGDKAYDSDTLDQELLKDRGIELIAPHKRNRKKPQTQDGRKLRRYRRRWKVERLFAWLQNYRRLVVRYEYHVENFLGFLLLGCSIILLRLF